MKKLLCLVLLLAAIGGVKAQGINWGARLGMNIGSISGDKGWDDYKSKIGFHLGVAADYELVQSLFLESGLYISTKGAKYKENGIEDIYSLTYLQLPILAAYKFDLGNEFKLHVKAGPYLALGLAAKNKYKDSSDPNDNETVKGFGKSEGNDEKTDLKRFDAGLQFGAGVSKGNYYLGLNYELGLSNLCIEDNWGKDAKAKNRNFNISLGYNF